MDKSQIFHTILEKIIISGTPTEQLDFLKVYPIYKPTECLFSIWIKAYASIMDGKKTQETKDFDSQKNCAINFLSEGLTNNFMNCTSADIFALIKKMEELSDTIESINLVKTLALKGKSNSGIKKIQTEYLTKSIENPDLKNNNSFLQEFSAKDFATELIVRSSGLFCNITEHDLLDLALNEYTIPKRTDKAKGPALKMIHDFHQLSYLVPTILLLVDHTIEARISTVKKFIKICKELRSGHNYHLLFAIVAGLNNLSVQRIPFLWKSGAAHTNGFIELCHLVNPSGNFSKYREDMKKNETHHPMVPYIGTVITELKHALEGDLYDFPNESLDWQTHNRIVDIVTRVKNTNSVYKLKSTNNFICEWIFSFDICDDDDMLYDMCAILKSATENHSARSSTESHNGRKSGGTDGPVRTDGSVRTDSPVKEAQSVLKPRIDISFLGENIGPTISVVESDPMANTHDPLESPTGKRNTFKKKKSKRRNSLVPMGRLFGQRDSAESRDSTETVGVETEINVWTPIQVKQWIESIGMGVYGDNFVREEICGTDLFDLANEHLKNDLHIEKLGHRLLMLRSIAQMKNNS